MQAQQQPQDDNTPHPATPSNLNPSASGSAGLPHHASSNGGSPTHRRAATTNGNAHNHAPMAPPPPPPVPPLNAEAPPFSTSSAQPSPHSSPLQVPRLHHTPTGATTDPQEARRRQASARRKSRLPLDKQVVALEAELGAALRAKDEAEARADAVALAFEARAEELQGHVEELLEESERVQADMERMASVTPHTHTTFAHIVHSHTRCNLLGLLLCLVPLLHYYLQASTQQQSEAARRDATWRTELQRVQHTTAMEEATKAATLRVQLQVSVAKRLVRADQLTLYRSFNSVPTRKRRCCSSALLSLSVRQHPESTACD